MQPASSNSSNRPVRLAGHGHAEQHQPHQAREHPAAAAAHEAPASDDHDDTESRVDLLDRLREVRLSADHILAAGGAAGAPAGWTREELTSLAWFSALLLSRLLASAPPAVQDAYVEHLAVIRQARGL